MTRLVHLGLDDTDTLDTPGTVHLGRALAERLADRWRTLLVTRHQLLDDPRVPCTRRNGCVGVLLQPAGVADFASQVRALIDDAAEFTRAWSPPGSDPGLCVAVAEPSERVRAWGMRCQHELVTQAEACALADAEGITLLGLGGTRDGIIGALAAVGLLAGRDDGRVVRNGLAEADHHHLGGIARIEDLARWGVDEVREAPGGDAGREPGPLVTAGSVELGKRLRPNLRGGRVVLYVRRAPAGDARWESVRVV